MKIPPNDSQISREHHAVLLAPVADLCVVRGAVEVGERVVEVVTRPGGVGPHVEEQVDEPGAKVVPVPLTEPPEHLLGPRHDGLVGGTQEVVHGGFVGVEPDQPARKRIADRLRVWVVPQAEERRCRLRIERVDVVVGALLHDVAKAPETGRNLPRHDLLERQVPREIDHPVVFADRERGDGRRAFEVQVSAVLPGQAHEPRAPDLETHAFDVALREIRPLLQDALVGRPARPVHLVVDPRRQAEPVGLVNGQPDPVEVLVAHVRDLQPVAPVQDHPLHALVSQLPELEPHLVRVELAVQEPERQDPELPRGLAERLDGGWTSFAPHRAFAHGVTVALTNPSGRSTAVRNASSMWSRSNGCVTKPSIEIRPDVRSRMPRRIPRMIVDTSRKCALAILNAIQFHSARGIVRGSPWWYPPITTVPLIRVTSPAAVKASCTPVISNVTSAPAPSVRPDTASLSDSRLTSTTCVAPIFLARSSASARVSATMTLREPRS